MSIYQSLFSLFQEYIYGGVELTADMNLVCTLVATIGCLLIVFLPFYVVYRVLALILGGV